MLPTLSALCVSRTQDTMSSWITCLCGRQLHTNLASGGEVSLLLPEEILEIPRAELSPDQIMGMLVTSADTVVQCPSCKRLAIARRTGSVDFFSPSEP
jgi:hypothetical protein